MKKHILLTGEIGCGKSTALLGTLALLDGVRACGLQTYYPEPHGTMHKSLYLRAWGDTQPGCPLGRTPDIDMDAVTEAFDTTGCALLESAKAAGELIVVDEIGRLEKRAARYHEALRSALEGDTPMLCVVRKLKAPWADWIRSHPNAELIEVTEENRNEVPALAAQMIKTWMK